MERGRRRRRAREREEVGWGLELRRDFRGSPAGKREAGPPLVGGEGGGEAGVGGVVLVLGGFCSVVSEGISDSKVNCGVLSLPSSNKQCSECLMFPSHRIS